MPSPKIHTLKKINDLIEGYNKLKPANYMSLSKIPFKSAETITQKEWLYTLEKVQGHYDKVKKWREENPKAINWSGEKF